MMPLCEIVNPSDECTIEGEPRVVAVAVLVLGNGKLGLSAQKEADELELPFFAFLSEEEAEPTLDAWCAEHLDGLTLSQFLDEHRGELADALESVLYGNYEDRATYTAGLDLITEPENRKQWRYGWEDRRRSSVNQLCRAAWALAKHVRAPMDADGSA